MKYSLLVTFLAFFAAPTIAATRTVPILFVEALAPRDTNSSIRFRNEYELSVKTAVKLTAKRLASCGYRVEPRIHFYPASDSLQVREKAAEAESSGTWFIVGPRRSDHYLLVANGAPNTPSASVMASSLDVSRLGPLHLSIYANNADLARAAAFAAKESVRRKDQVTYFSVVSEDCVTCKDFSKLFDKSAKGIGFKKSGTASIAGEAPDVSKATAAVVDAKPDVVLVPNYSKVSSTVISAIQKQLPSVLFIGGDGWGDGKFGFIENNPAVEKARGITVRGFPPTEIGLRKFAVGRQVLSGKKSGGFSPNGGPGMAIIRSFQGLADLLCESRPSTVSEFRGSFEKSGRKLFSAPWGVSVYRLQDGHITYWKAARR